MPSILSENVPKIENAFVVGQEATTSRNQCEEIMEQSGSNSYGSILNHNYEASDTISFHTPTTTAFVPVTTALEQYRLQLYNYALHMERLRYIPQDLSQQHHRHQQFSTVAHSSVNGYSTPAYASAPRLALSMSLFPQHIFKSEDPKPQHSYIGLIAMAILNSAELKLVLSDIYQYILDNYPYFRTRGPGWRNSIRHNLSLNDCFVKSGRSANGKGHYWAIHPANMDDFRKGDFRRRKAQRKVRKHMGLSVEDTGTDSPSPPPLDLSSSPPPAGSAHSFTVTQQIAAFNYLQQRQRPITVVGSPIGDQHLNFRPLTARYYVTKTPTSLSFGSPRIDTQNCSSSKAISGYASTSTASMIDMYTQTRKRQFDMASLLAPDVTVSNEEAELRETTTTTFDVGDDITDRYRTHTADRTSGVRTAKLQHTVITKVTMNQSNHHIAMEEEFTDDQNEDIDVVEIANDVNHTEHERKLERKVNSNIDECPKCSQCKIINEENMQENICNTSCVLKDGETPNSISTSTSDSRQSPFSDIPTNTDFVTSPLNRSESTTVSLIAKSRTGQSNYKARTDLNSTYFFKDASEDRILDENKQVNDNANKNHSSLDPIIFGRYYGTYMAAAARRLTYRNEL